MTTVTWVKDSDGRFEVSSAEHLKQLMHEGTLYTDAGEFPSDYWGTSRYIQTADIDLLNDSTDIKPIGVMTNEFLGDYDGGEFKISNWSYVDPNFSTGNAADCQAWVGLFGRCRQNVVENMRLDGLWTLQGFSSVAGFLMAYQYEISETSSHGVWNIECNFSTGSFMETGSGLSTGTIGGILGYIQVPRAVGVTLKGSIDFHPSTHAVTNVGGIVGYLYCEKYCRLFQNLATFPSGINGARVGGIAGRVKVQSSANVENFINAMSGNINGTQYTGGVIGYGFSSDVDLDWTNVVNAMTGNISSTSASGTGGIIGYFDTAGTNSGFLNYMTGSVSTSNTDKSNVGGIIGLYGSRANSLGSSINAMNGSVDGDAVLGYFGNGNNTYSQTVTVNQSFGLTFSSDTYGTSSPPSGLLTNSQFPDLPYVELSGLDYQGQSYEFDFVFANLQGNTSYSAYTHLVLHKGDVTTPFSVDFDIADTNTTVYATFVNASTKTVVQPLLSIIVPSLIDVTARAVNLPVVITQISGATSYQITYEGPTGGELTAVSGVTTLEHNIVGLEPETAYTIRLYADTGSGYEVTEELTATTLANVAENYDITDFQDANGVTDLSSLVEVVNDIFTTGDVVNLALTTEAEEPLNTTYVDLGGNVSLEGIDGLLLPFQNTGGSGQAVSLTLSDTVTTVPITYNEVANTITVDSRTRSTGDAFVLDGNVVEVYDYSGLTVLSVEEHVPSTVTPHSIDAPVVITELPGATAYQITYEGPNDGGEILVVSGTTELEHSIVGLEPETQYTVRIYADTGTEYELTEEIVTTTLPNVASNYDITAFQDTEGVTDLSTMNESTLTNISSVLPELLNTGESVTVSLGNTETISTSFVQQGESISITDNTTGILLPFSSTSGSGQTVDLTLSDATTVPVVYDESANTFSIDSVSHGDGSLFFLDGKKLEVSDFYGLTVMSVNEALMILTPKPINVHVLITEVPDLVWYKLTYEDSTGKVTTALQNVTTLQHNVLGLVSNTEYTFKLYADTGSGYVLTETLTITTLANVAGNYDVEDLKSNGVVELVSLPQSTIQDVAVVMNEIFSTGDTVEVALQNKTSKKTSTSFINLGDTLPIEQLSGVLIPFLQESGTGQEVSVVLSDGETTVGINYDDAVNSITVAGVVYYPGDSFILDGKKVSVVDFS